MQVSLQRSVAAPSFLEPWSHAGPNGAVPFTREAMSAHEHEQQTGKTVTYKRDDDAHERESQSTSQHSGGEGNRTLAPPPASPQQPPCAATLGDTWSPVLADGQLERG